MTDWFLQVALPLWWEKGTDHVAGGFFEKIGLDGAVVDEPRRTRVTARQIYVFSLAWRLGWTGPAMEAMQHGLDFMLQRQLRPDGTFVSAVRPDGTIVDPRFDLYEQAFSLFALASAFRCNPSWRHLPELAEATYTALQTGWQHPQGGFEESNPRSCPLKANPHMHLLEALLAWVTAAPEADKARWRQRGNELVRLCLDRFIDRGRGAVREYFDAQWRPMPDDTGRLVEPGHQFEWAWLLRQWPGAHLLPERLAAAARLHEIGESHGVGSDGLVVNALWDDLTLKDPAAKLWPQAERIKSWAASAEADGPLSNSSEALASGQVSLACAGLARYLEAAPPGQWVEVRQADGSFSAEPTRASSLYHIASAIESLHSLPVCSNEGNTIVTSHV